MGDSYEAAALLACNGADLESKDNGVRARASVGDKIKHAQLVVKVASTVASKPTLHVIARFTTRSVLCVASLLLPSSLS